MRIFFAIAFFLSGLGMAAYAAILQLVSLATNDPHDYQLLLRAGVAWSAASVGVTAAFLPLARRYWRLLALVPFLLCVVAWIGIKLMWPYAFA